MVKSLNLFKLLHNIFMFTVFVFSGKNEVEAARQNKNLDPGVLLQITTRSGFLEGWLIQDWTKFDTRFSCVRACNWSLQHTDELSDEPLLRDTAILRKVKHKNVPLKILILD